VAGGATPDPPRGVVRPRRVVHFARLIQRPGRVLGGPAVDAAFGGNLSLFWLPPRVINARTSGLLILFAWRSATSPETLAEGYPGTQRSSWPGTSSRRVDGEVTLWQPTARAVGVTHECSCPPGSYRTSRRPGSRRFHQESANELAQLQGQSVDPSHPVPHRGSLSVAAFVLIYGGGGSAWDWHLVAPALRERGHDPVAVDLPSEDESAGWSEHTDTVVRAVGDRSDLVVVGHSLGGFTAPLVCARLPAKLLVSSRG
jgi:hypothetical protein